MDASLVMGQVGDVAHEFAADRKERQRRRHLDRDDFDQLHAAGLTRTGLPVECGGLWSNIPESTRPICDILRTLARADPSVALVSSMHPAVLSYWLATPKVGGSDGKAWEAQRDEVFGTVEDGAWWGTITSEPGSGGDVSKTRSVATPADDGGYRLTGQKHFGSGSGISSYMTTTALPAGEDAPDIFYLPVAGSAWDGSTGMQLIAEWDGHGMIATQSHAMAFTDFPAIRLAWPGHLLDVVATTGPFIGSVFTAVVVGVVETAIDTARDQLEGRRDELRPFESVEWTQAEMEAWLIAQAYEGMLRAVETGEPALGAVLRAKTGIAQLAESCLSRLCRVLGGGSFARQSPVGNWFEDVRALGYLRPPWGLAFDALYGESFTPPPRG